MIASACVRIYTKPDSKFMDTMFDFPCHRHADAFYIISQFVDASEIDKSRTEQGFLTHDGRFLDRYDAMQHAIACGQMLPEDAERCAELYSEDLW
jgi:hypothetical protein